jgi:hypothetical protein
MVRTLPPRAISKARSIVVMPGRYAGWPAASICDDDDEAKRQRVRDYDGHAMPGADRVFRPPAFEHAWALS